MIRNFNRQDSSHQLVKRGDFGLGDGCEVCGLEFGDGVGGDAATGVLSQVKRIQIQYVDVAESTHSRQNRVQQCRLVESHVAGVEAESDGPESGALSLVGCEREGKLERPTGEADLQREVSAAHREVELEALCRRVKLDVGAAVDSFEQEADRVASVLVNHYELNEVKLTVDEFAGFCQGCT